MHLSDQHLNKYSCIHDKYSKFSTVVDPTSVLEPVQALLQLCVHTGCTKFSTKFSTVYLTGRELAHQARVAAARGIS